MSYLKEITWQVMPLSNPKVNKNCPKCGNHASFVNTEKFRVNANKNKLDVWLIYQCERCKSTWNMTIYERIGTKDISETVYKSFLENDKELATTFGFDKSIHVKNKVLLDYASIEYAVIGEGVSILNDSDKPYDSVKLKIRCKQSFDLRIDRLLSYKLGISRSQLKQLYKEGFIWSNTSKNLLKEKLYDGFTMRIEKI